jgi:hypothetical protein
MTVERAVRAMAGTFILASLALGYWVHEGFLLFTVFIGANLLQSGFTGFCPPTYLFRRLGLKDAACSHSEHAASAGKPAAGVAS